MFRVKVRFISFFMVLLGALHAAPPAAPHRLRVNDTLNPVGVGEEVFFGWWLSDADNDELQTAYQVRVASDPRFLTDGQPKVWDSGRVVSGAQNHVVIPGGALRADTRYHWQVRTWDRAGEVSAWSEVARFDTGLLEDADWAGARWIRRESRDADDYTRFRRSFALPADKPVVRAVAYVSAVHKYELYMNGVEAGKGQAYHHPQYQYFRAHDVTGLLEAGSVNQVAVFTHWFGGGQGRPVSARGLLVKIVVHHGDGSSTVLGSDSSWRQARAEAWLTDEPQHRNRGEGVGYVERIDGRRLDGSWIERGYDDTGWAQAVELGAHPVAPWTGRLAPELTRVVERIVRPAAIIRRVDGSVVVDFGRVWAGLPRVRLSGGEPGRLVTMRAGYVLDEQGGLPRGAKVQDALMEYEAILDGGVWVYAPIEYLGFRYLQIDNPPGDLTAEDVWLVARHAEWEDEAAAFESADTRLDAVWELMRHSLYTCALETFVDTPTREKGGFLGDAVIQSSVAMPVLHERALTRRVLGEFIQSMEQHWSEPGDRGRINAVYPNNDGARDIPDYTQAFLEWVWDYYMETGDRVFLERHRERLNEVGEYQARHLDAETGLIVRLTGGRGPYEHGIIDWPARMRYGYDMEAAARTVINARAYLSFVILARVAEELGRVGEGEVWRAKAGALAEAMNARLRRADGLYHDGLHADGRASDSVSQHANLFPLALGFVPADSRGAVADHVVEQRMRVGMVTVQWLVRALGEAGRGEALLDLLTRTDQPGWARTLSLGGTATWESWDADTNTDSMSHAWGAAGLEAHMRYILGVRPVRPQAEELLIAPLDFGERLPWARGRVATERGPVTVAWRRFENGYRLELELPVNTTARVALPTGGSRPARVWLDGREVKAEEVGGRWVVPGVGSGNRVLESRDRD